MPKKTSRSVPQEVVEAAVAAADIGSYFVVVSNKKAATALEKAGVPAGQVVIPKSSGAEHRAIVFPGEERIPAQTVVTISTEPIDQAQEIIVDDESFYISIS